MTWLGWALCALYALGSLTTVGIVAVGTGHL